MGVFIITTKAEAAKKLEQVKKEFEKKSLGLNLRRIIPAILCLEESLYNLGNDIITTHKIEKGFEENPELYSSFMEFLLEWKFAIDEIIAVILKNGFDDPTTKIELPGITFGIYTDRIPEQHLEEGFTRNIAGEIEKGRIGKNDILFLKRKVDFLPGSRTTLGFYYAFLNSNASKHAIDSVDLIVKLRDLYVQQAWLGGIINDFPVGTEAYFDDAGSAPIKLTFPKDFSYEKFYNEKDLSPRFLDTNLGMADWNSNLRDAMINNLKHGKPQGLENFTDLLLEFREIGSSGNLEGFPEVFEKAFGIPLEPFSEILIALVTICYHKRPMVGIWSTADLINDRRLKKFSPDYVKKVVALLSKTGIRKVKSPFLLPIGNLIVTNCARLLEVQFLFRQECFDDYYNNGKKGPAFEEACRNIMQKKNINLVPNCIKINEPMIQKDVCEQIGIKYKANTELEHCCSARKFSYSA